VNEQLDRVPAAERKSAESHSHNRCDGEQDQNSGLPTSATWVASCLIVRRAGEPKGPLPKVSPPRYFSM